MTVSVSLYLSLYSVPFICVSFWASDHALFMTMVLYYILKSGMVIIFFIRFVLTMWNLLYFYMSYFITLIYLCMCVCLWCVYIVCAHVRMLQGQLIGVSCLLPLCGFWILNLGHQIWCLVSFLGKPLNWPFYINFKIVLLFTLKSNSNFYWDCTEAKDCFDFHILYSK